jgi:hypothetical protein
LLLRRKLSNEDFQAAMANLANSIELRADADIVVYLFGEITEDLSSKVVNTAASVQAGEWQEEEGLWRVVAAPHPGATDTGEGWAQRAGLQPVTWTGPTLFSTRLLVQNGDVQRVHVASLFPT